MLGSLFAQNLEANKRRKMDNSSPDLQVTGSRSRSRSRNTPSRSQNPTTTPQSEGMKGKTRAAAARAAEASGSAGARSASDAKKTAQPQDTPESVLTEDGEDEEQDVDDSDSDDDVDNFTTSEIVTVYVGSKRKRFHLHRDLICQRSPFMEKCLSKNRFSEGQKNELYLPEDEPKAFSILVDWIYRGKLPLLSSNMNNGLDLLDLSAAYCMADKFGMEELQNNIIDWVRGSHRLMTATYAQAHSHSHHGTAAHTSHSARDTIRIGHGLMSSMSGAERDATSSSALSPEACRPNYAALSLCHATGPPKSPLKRFLIEHLVYHMMMFPKYYHNDLTRNFLPQRQAAVGSAAPAVATTTAPPTTQDKVEFERLFENPELSLHIMRKIWQWQMERWGDPSRAKDCAYHVHSSTQCEYKKAGGMNAQMAASAKAGMNRSPNNSAALLQGLGAARVGSSSWMGGSTSQATGAGVGSLGIGGWHPGVGW